MDTKYYALVADVKRSRNIDLKIRQRVQCQIEISCDYLNRFFEKSLVKPVSFSGGDEIQGLFQDLPSALLYYRFLACLMSEASLRGGVGVGTWDVRMKSQSSAAQDGGAYHAARSAIDAAEDMRKYDLVVRLNDDKRRLNYSSDNELAVLCDHCLSIMEMRTDSQRGKAMLIELLAPIPMIALPDWYYIGFNEYRFDYLENVNRFLSEYMSTLDGKSTIRSSIAGALSCRFDDIAPEFYRYIDEGAREHRSLFLSSSLRGITYLLSDLLDISRVSLDKQLAKARVDQERNAAVLLALFAGRY